MAEAESFYYISYALCGRSFIFRAKIIVMTSAPGGIYKIIDNPLFSDKNFRDREIFSSLSKEIRNYLKKAGSKNER